MRQFIRHPTDVPIEYSLSEVVDSQTNYLHDVSHGGLSFSSDQRIKVGASIHIGIPIDEPVFEADAIVVWCRPVSDHYDIGVAFESDTDEFGVRMVEQICYIERYKKAILVNEGRHLTGEEAAAEWLTANADTFPR